MARQAAQHIRNRAERLRKTAERRRCPECKRGGGLCPRYSHRRQFGPWPYKCRYCGHFEIYDRRI